MTPGMDAFLVITADALCAMADCRIVRFMFHDRVAFGGTLIAVATLYLWLACFPLRLGLRGPAGRTESPLVRRGRIGLLATGVGITGAGLATVGVLLSICGWSALPTRS